MSEVAVFTCGACTFDGDAPFRWSDRISNSIIWDCPGCGVEHEGELDLTDYDAGRDCDD